MHSLIDAAMERWRTVLLMLLFILFAGYGSYMAVPKEAAPDIEIPFIYVSVRLEGIAPEDAERLLLRPMEKKLASISSVKEMRSEAIEGFASVSLEFDAGFDSDAALADVRAKMDEVKPDLPDDAEEPVVTELNFSTFPILNINLTGEVGERTLLRIARDLRDKLEALSNVLEVKIIGEREEVLEIIIDPLVLESYHISPVEVFQRVDNNNILITAGKIDTKSGRYSLKLSGLIEKYNDLLNVPIKVDGGTVTTLSDIATIQRHFKDVETYARVNGKPGLLLAVSKRTGANIIETVSAARAVVERERKLWPQGVEVLYAQDQSGEILSRLTDLQNNIILAIILVSVVIMWFMGFRSAGLVAFSIPGAFLFSIACIYLLGITLNIVVLFALILSVGMLVDSAIVVSEYADRLLKRGEPAVRAYPASAKRMAWPIIASTVTTLVAFMPLLFWPGMVGEFMKYMPMTLILTLSGSLIMALIFVPVLGGKFGGNKNDRAPLIQGETIDDEEDSIIDPKGSLYAHLLKPVLRYPGLSATGVLVFVIVIMILFAKIGPGVEFFPKIEPNNARILIKARGNQSVEEKDAIMKQVEARVKGMEGVKILLSRAGTIPAREATDDSIGMLELELVDWRDRPKADEILADMRNRLVGIPGVAVETVKQQKGPPVGKAIQLEFSSRTPAGMELQVQKVLAGMEKLADL